MTGLFVLLSVSTTMAAETAAVDTPEETAVLDLGALSHIDAMVQRLADKQLVCVGETHARYDHHMNQLEIIRGLYALHPDLVIGMEFFQQPFQKYLGRYINGQIDEKALLRHTEYFERWRYDYRLYRPILRFAREHRIPVIALNIPVEITEKVARKGMASLNEEERRQIPANIDHSNKSYEARLRGIFEKHPKRSDRRFEDFLDTQLLWDEGMAQRAADHFKRHPEGHMVLLAGSGHLMYGDGIPDRVRRRVPVETAVVINGTDSGIEKGVADFLLLSKERMLPRGGMMGVLLDIDDEAVKIKEFADDSPAKKAGLKKGDRIVRLAGEPVKDYSDIRIALLGRLPGEEVEVVVVRHTIFIGDERFKYRVKLQ
ncbi:MAG TPA: PDZ domain-containing protein [Kiloniellaceae bacterium]|nr:PDZ domain-containing protein [Kiloniellaceae bacterium]